MLRARPDGFLLMSSGDLIDRRDLISLVAVDDSLIIDQMLFAAGGSDTSKLREHSLLMSGHFDETRIFKAALENGASVLNSREFEYWCSNRFHVSVARSRICVGWR